MFKLPSNISYKQNYSHFLFQYFKEYFNKLVHKIFSQKLVFHSMKISFDFEGLIHTLYSLTGCNH